MSEQQVEAAYLYNFAKFVEWPARAFDSPTAPIRLCVLSDEEFVGNLSRIVKGKTIAGRSANVVHVQTAEQSRDCHILFIDSSHDRWTPAILEVLRNSSVLTVGASKLFAKEGGIINFVRRDTTL